MSKLLSVLPAATLLALCVACSDPGVLTDAGPLMDGRIDSGVDISRLLLDDTPPLPGQTVDDPRPPVVRRHRVIFLQFSGATITKGKQGSAPGNVSEICGGIFPPFDHTPLGTDRHKVIQQIVQQVDTLLKDFNVTLLTSRPKAAPYDMVVVAGVKSGCGQPPGIGGLAPLDCDDAHHQDVAFIFAGAITQVQMLATVIAHEAAHTYGLVHTSEACDVMSPVMCTTGDKQFLDKQMAVWPDHMGRCGMWTANSWKMLYKVLGPRLPW